MNFYPQFIARQQAQGLQYSMQNPGMYPYGGMQPPGQGMPSLHMAPRPGIPPPMFRPPPGQYPHPGQQAQNAPMHQQHQQGP